MAEFKDRLNEALQLRGMTAAELSRLSGVPESAISQYRSGKYKAAQKALDKIARVLRVSIPWLMGTDVDIRPPVSVPPPAAESDSIVSFPVLADIAAGYGHMAVPADAEIVDIPRQYLRGRPASDYFLMRVVGSSMYPLYHDGDIVLVLKQATMNRSGEIGVVIYNDESATLKKIEYVMGEDWMRLVPVNPSYEPIMVTDERLEHCRVIGIPRLLIRRVSE